ncbi:MAG TPA: glycosyltransferase family 87 protein, partial [Bacteroidota bacterium]|nr:glycosyltransferase family 87 protein [Bacteroidota bacterium]
MASDFRRSRRKGACIRVPATKGITLPAGQLSPSLTLCADQISQGTLLLKSLRTLAILFALGAGAHLLLEVWEFGQESLQADFAAYYTAGESVSAGCSPYRNNIDRGIWDGIAHYRHSRFLYPPLVADIFRPLAAMPYASAKKVWMVLMLCATAGGTALAMRALHFPRGGARIWLFAGAAFLFYPLAVLLERGQIDGLTMLLVSSGAVLLCREPDSIPGGALLALATLFKLPIAFLLPVLIMRRRWRAAASFVTTGAAIFLISLAVDGPSTIQDYVTSESARIAAYGEEGTPDMALPDSILGLAATSTDVAEKDHHVYLRSAIAFAPNATVVRLLAGLPRRLHFTASLLEISIGSFVLFMTGLIMFTRRLFFAKGSLGDEFAL